MAQLWGGRFTKQTDAAVYDFNASIRFDRRFWRQDIRGSLAHVRMLGRQGILTAEETEQITGGLNGILTDLEEGRLEISETYEDIHSFVEATLISRIGDAGKKLHTGRSRNDQVALDMKLYVRDEITELDRLLLTLLEVIQRIMEENSRTCMPGFTHLQKAQPLTVAHHFGAYFEMFRRDRERLSDCRRRMNLCPLGAGALAAAAAVKRYLELSGKPGTVIFYGCPGEEGGSGKAFLAREGLWKKLDAALSWHPSDVNQVETGTNNSSIQVLYRFSGVAAHAAGEPYNGRSALDAVELMNVGVQFLREHMKDDCRIHYAITDAGGVSPNVVQAKAAVLYMVRANKVTDSVALQKRVDDIAKGAALMTGTSFERVFIDGTAELLPNYALEELLYQNMAELGAPQFTEEETAFAAALRETYPHPDLPGIGARADASIAKQVRELTENGAKPLNDFLMPLYHGTLFTPGSTDVGDVSWLTPTAQIHTVTWPDGVPGHSWQVVACGKSSMAHKGMRYAAKALAGAAIDLIEDPDILAAAREEFEEKSASGYVCPIEPGAVPTAL